MPISSLFALASGKGFKTKGDKMQTRIRETTDMFAVRGRNDGLAHGPGGTGPRTDPHPIGEIAVHDSDERNP